MGEKRWYPTTSFPGRLSLALELGRTTSKVREKRPGDEVGCPISMSEMLVVMSAGCLSVHNYQLRQYTTPENTLIPWHTIILFVGSKILHKPCLQFLLGVKMAPKVVTFNWTPRFWREIVDKPRFSWIVCHRIWPNSRMPVGGTSL